jgi:hypothetical protein
MMAVLGGVVLLSGVLLVTEQAAPLFVAVYVVATLAAGQQGWRVWTTGGLWESEGGLSNQQLFGQRRWAWDEIERFAHVDSRVYVVTRSRKATRLVGVAEGWRNTWQDGESREITDLLNERLIAWQSPSLSKA